MKFSEETKDLFSVSKDYYLAQCISADFAMGAGIAVQFNKHFDIKNKLTKAYTNWLKIWDGEQNPGYCLCEGKVLNLITKRNYWNKPTYKTLENALIAMKIFIKDNDIKKLAMPQIGCGLDKLRWDKVSEMIIDIFKDTDVEILVCKK